MAERILAGRYRPEGEIGRGSSSIVYRVRDLRLDKTWALKWIRKPSAYSPAGGSSEVALLKDLDHPALPRVVDVWEEAEGIALVMDEVPGEDLDSYLQRHGPIREACALSWMQELASVLAYLHSRHPAIVHQDLKPANIVRRRGGALALLDFGIARAREDKEVVAQGTRGYAAPEQCAGSGATPCSDVYALGVTMITLLRGIPPDPKGTRYTEDWLRQELADLSPGFRRILQRTVEEDPLARYEDGAALLGALQILLRRQKQMHARERFLRPAVLAGVMFLEVGVTLGRISPTPTRAGEDPITTAQEAEETQEQTQEKHMREIPEKRSTLYSEYNDICRRYLLYEEGLQEPTAEELTAIARMLPDLLAEVRLARGEDSVRLLLLQSVLDLTREHRQGFVLANVSEQDLQEMLTEIRTQASDIQVRGDDLRDLQRRIQEEIPSLQAELRATYHSMEKWKAAEEAGKEKE